jgi:hypothetical protein
MPTVGLARWNRLKTVKASLSIMGAIWQVKDKPDVLKNVSIKLTCIRNDLLCL